MQSGHGLNDGEEHRRRHKESVERFPLGRKHDMAALPIVLLLAQCFFERGGSSDIGTHQSLGQWRQFLGVDSSVQSAHLYQCRAPCGCLVALIVVA